MVTETNDVKLTWDAFLDDEDDGVYSQVAGFRETEWHNIRRQLRNDYNWDVPDGLEPHWIAPGRAVFWQLQTVRERVMRVDDNGRNRPVIEDVERGWAPTTAGLPAGSASQIAHWFDKGLRMRPPVDGVDAETTVSRLSQNQNLKMYSFVTGMVGNNMGLKHGNLIQPIVLRIVSYRN